MAFTEFDLTADATTATPFIASELNNRGGLAYLIRNIGTADARIGKNPVANQGMPLKVGEVMPFTIGAGVQLKFIADSGTARLVGWVQDN